MESPLLPMIINCVRQLLDCWQQLFWNVVAEGGLESRQRRNARDILERGSQSVFGGATATSYTKCKVGARRSVMRSKRSMTNSKSSSDNLVAALAVLTSFDGFGFAADCGALRYPCIGCSGG